MKKVMLLVVMAMGFVLTGFAYGPWGGVPSPEFDNLREIMQYGNHDAKKLDDGIWVSLLSDNEELVVKIKSFFTSDPEELKKYFGDTTVKISEVATGVEITLTSDNKKTVDELHYFGPMLVYGYLRDLTFKKANNGGSWRGGFFGHRGPGRGPWFGHGHWPGRPSGYYHD